jgi:hypothetical protein
MSAVSTPESAKARQSLPGSTSYSPGPELLLLRMAAEVLRTPHKVLVTSLIFMHRFKARSVSFEADTCEVRANDFNHQRIATPVSLCGTKSNLEA